MASNVMKKRILLLRQWLYEHTDEKHPASTEDIMNYLRSQGMTADRKTLASDIALLNETGADIVKIRSTPNQYYWRERIFEIPEVRLIIDAVSSSRFITAKKSKALIQKLENLTSQNQAKDLASYLAVTNRVKSDTEKIYEAIDEIADAINKKKKISFKYLEYSIDRKKIFRNHGEIYVVSPYYIYRNEDFYYIVGLHDGDEEVTTYRVDRLSGMKILNERIQAKPKNLSKKSCFQTDSTLGSGRRTRVELQCPEPLVVYVMDQFDEHAHVTRRHRGQCTILVETELGPKFYGWLFQFGGRMQLLGPKRAQNEFRDMVRTECV